MHTATDSGTSITKYLAVTAVFCAALLVAMVIACLPYFGKEDAPPSPSTEQTVPETTLETTLETEPETTVETEPEQTLATMPPLPESEANPYGANDFQYDSRNFLYCTKAKTIPGIDLSSYQGTPDWQKVKDYGVEFAMIRIGYRGYGSGKLVEDPTARPNLEGASSVGIKIGAYFFSQAVTVEEAAEEAQFLLDIIKDYNIEMPVVFDWEEVAAEDARTADTDSETLTACTAEFCRILEEAGYQPMIYFNRHQAKYKLDLSQLTQYPFWLAAYTDRMHYPYRFEMWQYTDSGRIAGIDGNVDLDMWFVYE